MRFYRSHDILGDLILDREDIFQQPVVALCPNMLSVRGIDELPCDADATARRSDTAFKDISDTKIASDLADVDRPALVNEGGVARDDEQPAQTRKCGNDVLGHPIREEFLLWIAAHVVEGQYRDGWLVWQCEGLT